MFGIEVRSISGAVLVALAMATGSVQPSQAAGTVLTGSKIAPAIASAVPAGQTTEPVSASADNLRQNLDQDSVERHHSKKRRGVTFGVPGGALAATLDGVKLLGWKGPGADHNSGFDVTVEFNGLGLQFEDQGTYGYMRADRVFSGSDRVGIQFRYRF